MAADVHAYTKYFNINLHVLGPYLNDGVLVTQQDLQQCVNTLVATPAYLRLCRGGAGCNCRVAMSQVTRTRSPMLDPDLNSRIELHKLMARCIEYALDHHELAALHETLVEIGGTCIQGISHRLMYLYMAWHELY